MMLSYYYTLWMENWQTLIDRENANKSWRCSETEIELPTYFFEFLIQFSKLKSDWSIQRHWESVTKLYWSCQFLWQLFLQPQIIDGAWVSGMETLLALLAAVMVACAIIRTLDQQPCGCELRNKCNATCVPFTFFNYVMTFVSEHLSSHY